PRDATTDAEGEFRFSGLFEGTYRVGASARGCATESGLLVDAGREGLEIVLDVGLSLTGIVTSREGGGIGGAEIMVSRAEEGGGRRGPGGFDMRMMGRFGGGPGGFGGPGGRGEPNATSRPDGTFEVEGLRVGVYVVYAQCDGYLDEAKTGVSVGDGDASPVELVLNRGLVIEGTVFDPSEHPLAGARVTASPRFPSRDQADPNAGGRGRGRNRGGPGGPGQGPGQGQEQDPRAVFDEMRRARDSQPDRPEGFLPGFRRFETETGADGRFRFASLGNYTYEIQADKEPFLPAQQGDVQPGGEPIRLVLSPGVEMAGRVIDAKNGSGVSNAMIMVAQAQGFGGPMPSTRTDENGRFSVTGVVPGAVRVRVRAQGYLPAWVESEAPTTDTEIAVNVAGKITGQVVDTSGAGVAGARVSLRPVEAQQGGPGGRGFFRGGRSGQSLADGFFEIAIEQGEGTFAVAAEHADFISGSSEPFSISDPSAEIAGITVVLRLGAVLEGRVTGIQGAPVAGASVFVEPAREEGDQGPGGPGGPFGRGGPGGRGGRGFAGGRRARTTVDGDYHFSGLEGGTYVVRVDAETYIRYEKSGIQLAEGAPSRHDVSLTPENAIAGHVVDRGGTPLTGATVSIRRGGAGRAVADQAGRFRIGRLEEGVFDLEARYPGFSPQILRSIPVNTYQEIVLLEFGGIAGAVTGATTREPVTPFQIRLQPADPESFAGDWGLLRGRTFDDPSGLFRFEGLPPGSYTLVVETGVHLPGRVTVDVPPGVVREGIIIPLDEGAVIAGFVFDPDGKPLAGARIRAVRLDEVAVATTAATAGAGGRPQRGGPGGGQPLDLRAPGGGPGGRAARGGPGGQQTTVRIRPAGEGESNDRGRFNLSGLEAGKYILEASHDDYVSGRSKPIEVTGEGAPPEATVKLQEGARVVGQVFAESDAGGTVWVVLNGPDGSKRAQVQPDGSFTVRGLAPGSYSVRAYGQNRRPADAQTVQVTGKQDVEIQVTLP
ncbi:MAG: carboxypeptidase regulatory-like domain-containing protein, partial [Planctomycetes bacterium]|nr:carboxypeptidase regulatory-like domain-containing protein [Planctomycetota bacterium]